MKYDYPQVAGAILGEERVQQALEMASKESVNEKRQEILAAGESDDSFDEDAYYNAVMRKHENRANKVRFRLIGELGRGLIVIFICAGPYRNAF